MTEATPSGGSKTYRKVAANDTNADVIKAAPGKVHGWHLVNKSAATRYVKLYDKATTPVVGTDTPAITVQIPANSAETFNLGNNGPQFDTGIGVGIVTGAADSDTTAPTAGDVIAQIFYR